jgi:hypothetical protein
VLVVTIVLVGLTLGGCRERLEIGTIEDFTAATASEEGVSWIGVRLSDGRYIRASITQAQAESNGISAETAAKGSQQVEVLMHWRLSLGDMTYWEFVRTVEQAQD